jgi:hypothetical protein
MIDLNELKELAENCRAVQLRLAEPGGSVGYVLAHAAHEEYFTAIPPSTILKLLEVIRMQGEALEYIDHELGRPEGLGLPAPIVNASFKCRETLAETKKILGGE